MPYDYVFCHKCGDCFSETTGEPYQYGAGENMSVQSHTWYCRPCEKILTPLISSFHENLQKPKENQYG